jgi:hypothetical protein
MTTTLATIASKIASRPVRLDADRTVTIRALRVSEHEAVQDCFPRPAPPFGPDPTKGSNAPPIQRPDDVIYNRALRRWYANVMLAEVAIGIGLVLEDGRPFPASGDAVTDNGWLVDATKQLRDKMTDADVRLLHEAIDQLGTVAMVKEAIRVLVVERDGSADVAPEIRIPEDYDNTETGLLLSAAERFGVGDPIAWIDGLDAGKRAMMLANELVRRQEENEKMRIAAAAVGIAGL